jgi:hypothetical protein
LNCLSMTAAIIFVPPRSNPIQYRFFETEGIPYPFPAGWPTAWSYQC